VLKAHLGIPYASFIIDVRKTSLLFP